MSLMILPSFEYIGVNISGMLSKFSICSLVRQKKHQPPKTKLKMDSEANVKQRQAVLFQTCKQHCYILLTPCGKSC